MSSDSLPTEDCVYSIFQLDRSLLCCLAERFWCQIMCLCFVNPPEKPGIFFHWLVMGQLVHWANFSLWFCNSIPRPLCGGNLLFPCFFHDLTEEAVLFIRFGTSLDPGAANALAHFTQFCTTLHCGVLRPLGFLEVNLCCCVGCFLAACDKFGLALLVLSILWCSSSSPDAVLCQFNANALT